jgi:adenosylhomocysteine nucleosidase
MTRVAIIAALNREVAPLVHRNNGRYKCDSLSYPKGIDVWTSEDTVIAIAGMGEGRASLAFEAALSTGPISEIISAGWAGACLLGQSVGSVVKPSTIVNARTGERFQCAGGDGSVLATVASFAGTEEKHRLNATYGATAVEMEAATVARLAQMHGLPFRAIKAISDTSDFDFPEIERFHTLDGQFREAAFGAYVMLRPWLWRPVLHMAKGSKLAAESLCAELRLQVRRKDREI